MPFSTFTGKNELPSFTKYHLNLPYVCLTYHSFQNQHLGTKTIPMINLLAAILVGWLVGFLTPSTATRLICGRAPRLESDNFTCCPHTRQCGETMTSVSASHPVGRSLALSRKIIHYLPKGVRASINDCWFCSFFECLRA